MKAARKLNHADLLSRAFWLVMMAGHAPALVKVWAETLRGAAEFSAIARTIALSGAFLLFALKLVDVRWLRIPADRRAWIGLVLAIALIHAGVPSHMDASPAAETAIWQLALTVGVVAAFGAALELLVSAFAPSVRSRRNRSKTQWLAALDRAFNARLRPFLPLLTRSARVNRAPPLTF